MIDIQSTKPDFNLPIHRVGISGLKIPIYISDKQRGVQHSVADVDVYVDLCGEDKGTHMSRLAIGVQKFADQQLNLQTMQDIALYIKEKACASTSQVIYKFPYFIKKIAPVSKEPGYIHCDIEFNVTYGIEVKSVLSVSSYVTSLCPCSKEISENGAHNQRSKIKITGEPNKWVWIEDLNDIADNSCSCPLFSVLKRKDEKYVTEYAYNNPKFVEDMVRLSYNNLLKLNAFNWFEIEVWNMESIHTHDAYAKMRFDNSDSNLEAVCGGNGLN